MLRPPTSALFSANRTTEEPAAGRRGIQAARRAVLVQCAACGCKGSGSASDRGRLTSTNLTATCQRGGRITHTGCGGALVPFDIAEGTL